MSAFAVPGTPEIKVTSNSRQLYNNRIFSHPFSQSIASSSTRFNFIRFLCNFTLTLSFLARNRNISAKVTVRDSANEIEGCQIVSQKR